jgi:hypothetical protein
VPSLRDWGKWWLQDDIRSVLKALGPLRFCLLLAGLIALLLLVIAISGWLNGKTGWPDAYGFHCQGRGCYLKEFQYSHRLLEGGSLYERLLFVWIWCGPVLLGCVGVIRLLLWMKTPAHADEG